MGSDLETLCGQAVGAGQLHILGIYMQRSWIITLVTATALTPLYVFTAPILKLLHQPDDTSDLGHGVRAAAMVENVSWWLINLAQMIYLGGGLLGRLRGLPFKKGGTRKQSVAVMSRVASYVN
ncbi:unnamed protein product [Musa hybrid cultivar]